MAALVGAACGGGTTKGVDAFVGAWLVSGNGFFTCNSATYGFSSAAPVRSYQIALAKGQNSDLSSIDSLGCQLLWDVSGKTATIRLNQGCTASSPSSSGPAQGNLTIAVSGGSATLTVVDSNHLSGIGNLTGSFTQASPLAHCGMASGLGNGTLTRVGN
jgi:hypothetical protein